MFLTSVKRIIRGGITNFRRGGTVSVASVLVVTITLSVIAAIIFLQALLQTSLAAIRDRVDVTVYFTTNAPEEKIFVLQGSLQQLPEVREVAYLSREQVLEEFRERHQDDYVSLRALDELNHNPFGATLNIRARDPAQYESISRFLDDSNPAMGDYVTIVERVNYAQNKIIIDRLTSIIAGAERLGFAVTLVLALVSALITYNTIRLAIFISREEIGVMRLVGAENKYIRGPFLVEGALYGVIGSILTMAIFWPVTLWLKGSVGNFLGIDLFRYYTDNFFQILGILLLVGIAVSTLSSAFAVRRYLKQ